MTAIQAAALTGPDSLDLRNLDMTIQRTKIAVMAALAVAVLAGCSKPDDQATLRANFETGVRSFLADGHDQVCLAMYDWPMDLTEAEAGANDRHAVQLPVFEKLGLAKSTIIPVPKSATNPDGAIKRYELTEEGRKYYKPHAYKSRDGATHQNDFCVAQISLDKVESWEIDPKASTATVSYSYQVAPAPWMQDPEAQRILPMVAQVIKGAGGGLQMHQGFARSDKGWVAVPGAV